MMSSAVAIAAVRRLPKNERTAKVNELMPGNADDKAELTWRALLITELREAEVWPQGCK